MYEIRVNSLRGRYDQAIASMKDTSTMVTPQVVLPSSQVEAHVEAR
jgi:hypothetical protein